MTYTFTYFRPARPSAKLDDRAYAAVHAKQVTPDRVVTKRTLKGLRRWIERHAREGRKGDAGYIVAGEVVGTRQGDDTGPASFALIDYDGSAPDWDALDEYEGFAWTTASHTDEAPAWRVVIPFREPAEHSKLRCPFAGGHIRNRSQPAFLPTQRPGAPEVEWRDLAGSAHLDAAALEPPRRASAPRGASSETGRGFPPDLSALDALVPPAGVTDRVADSGGRHVLVRALGGWCAELGFSPDEVYEGVFHGIASSDPAFRAEQAKDAAERKLLGLETVGYMAVREWCEGRKGGKKAFRKLEAALRDPDMPDGFEGVWTVWWRTNYKRAVESIRKGQAHAKERAKAERVEHGEMTPQGTRTCPRTGWPWILQKNQTYWLHDPDLDTYGAQAPAAELEVRVREAYVGNGMIEPGDPSKLAGLKSDGWIQAVEKVVYDYRVENTTYDLEERTVRCAALRRMPASRAKFHPEIDHWLRTLFEDHYERVAQWIASCSHLDRLAPCLYIVSSPVGGKGLLFNGLARLWGCSSPVPMAEVISDFNEKQVECPLVYTDEGFPAGLEFTRFRSMVSDHDRRVNRKGLAKVDVCGCTRNAVGANNNGVLRWARHGELTHNDQQAIAERLLVVECSDEAAARAKALLYDAPVHAWAEGLIAEHALWLAKTIDILPKGRWCVEPYGGETLIRAVVNDRYALFAGALLEALKGGEAAAERLHVWRSPKDDRTIYVHAEQFLKHLMLENPRTHLGDVRDACKALAGPGGDIASQRRIPGTSRESKRPLVYALDGGKVDAAAGLSSKGAEP